MTATNTLNKGLVMDFNPIIAKDDYLTNALNATLLTFNGNEMQLQQDMGNGRVETAFLPEGYIPVGTCEFGDIIYIVSYNPLENKSQIGCFPSPERNISSDEVSDMEQSLSASDFQVGGTSPTGKLKATSVKKIIYGNKNMNPGDKYIIYEEKGGDGLLGNAGTLSDYGNTSHQLNQWPKLLKLKVVSIEDSGKIVDLGASVKWYDEDYYLASLESNKTTGKPDIDSYRSLVSSAYSVFQSKVSGKLAILAELEAIDGFSCSYDVYTQRNEEDGTTTYRIYFYTSWETYHNDVNPSGIIVTKSAWTDTDNGGKILFPDLRGDDYIYAATKPVENLPVAKAATTTGYDNKAVVEYTRLYELNSPSDTYDTYLKTASFNAQIEGILTWKAGENVVGDVKKLRPITKVTRLLDTQGECALGEPLLSPDGQKYLYVFNLDSHNTVNGKLQYYTNANDGTEHQLVPVALTDDVINNYFHKDTPKLLVENYPLQTHTVVKKDNGKFELVENDLSNLIWNYGIAPVMPYGVLDYLETTGTIDFSKLGTGKIDLSAWRYYTSGNLLTLTWGLDAYPEANKGIAEVVMDFYDNQGFAASYHVTGKSSFSGKFTDNIVLGQQKSSYRMSDTDAYGVTHIHTGDEIEEGQDDSNGLYLDGDNKPRADITSEKGPYKNNAGTLDPNMLYLVRITVKYCPKDLLGNFVVENTSGFKTFYRWVWTNGIFNQEYYNIEDFITLQPRLGIDFSATFNTKGEGGTKTLEAKYTEYRSADLGADIIGSKHKTLAANVYHINQSGEDDQAGNILLTLDPGLAEGYNTFNLNLDTLKTIDNVEVKLGASKITKNIEPNILHTDGDHIELEDDSLLPQIAPCLDSHESSSGWDRSGYANYNYGKNNAVVSEKFLTLLDPDLQRKTATYSDNCEGDGLKVEGSIVNTHLYDEASSYLNYLDSFSLNIVGGSLVAKNDTKLTYTDVDGEDQTLNHYTQKIVTLEEARTSGIKLALTGITFSKLYASAATVSSDAKVLRSIMGYADAEGREYNCPKGMGLKLVGNHLYFANIITWGVSELGLNMGGHSNAFDKKCGDHRLKVKWGGKRFTPSGTGWSGTEAAEWWGQCDGESGWNNIETFEKDWDSDFAQFGMQNLGQGPFSALVLTTTDTDYDGDSIWSKNRSWTQARRVFGLQTTDKPDRLVDVQGKPKEVKAKASLTNFSRGPMMPHTILIRDVEQNLWVPLNDYFFSKGNDQKATTGYAHSEPTLTLADMLGSLLIQLYTVDSSSDTYEGVLFKGFGYLQDYTELWQKDIIVQVDPSDLETSEVQDLILVRGQMLSRYLEVLKKNSNLEDVDYDSFQANVDIALYGVQRVINFQFGVPYNLGNLRYQYELQGQPYSKIRLAELDEKGDPIEVTFNGAVEENKLYTWTGERAVPFGSGSSMVYASEFTTDNDGNLYFKRSTKKIKATSFATLAKCMQYEDGEISFARLDRFTTWGQQYNILWDCDADKSDNGFYKIPSVSFFNEVKVQ